MLVTLVRHSRKGVMFNLADQLDGIYSNLGEPSLGQAERAHLDQVIRGRRKDPESGWLCSMDCGHGLNRNEKQAELRHSQPLAT